MSVDQQPDVGRVVREIANVGRGELLVMLAHRWRQQLGVLHADAKRQQRAAVANDGMIRGRVELPGQLMAQCQAETVLPRFGKHDRRRGRCQRLEFVEI